MGHRDAEGLHQRRQELMPFCAALARPPNNSDAARPVDVGPPPATLDRGAAGPRGMATGIKDIRTRTRRKKHPGDAKGRRCCEESVTWRRDEVFSLTKEFQHSWHVLLNLKPPESPSVCDAPVERVKRPRDDMVI